MTEPAYFHAKQVGGIIETRGASECRLGHEIPRPERNATDGIFAKWTWDGSQLVVQNDKFGFFPLYYYQRDTEVGLSTSIPLLLQLGAPRELDDAALSVFLRMGYFLGEGTPFKAIRVLPPDATLTWSPGRFHIESKWELPKPSKMARDEALEAFTTAVRKAVERRLPGGKRSAVLLSGGRDSRYLLLELCATGHRPDFCITLAPSHPYSGEDRVAAEVCQAVGVEHKILPHPGSKFAAEYGKNILTNFCASEHWWLLPARKLENLSELLLYDGIGADVLIENATITPNRVTLYERGQFRELAQIMLREGERASKAILSADAYQRMSFEVAVDTFEREMVKHAGGANPYTSLIFWNRTRRMIGLAPYAILSPASVVFSPFLDHDVHELLASLPEEMFVDCKFRTQAIHQTHPQFAQVPYFSSKGQPRHDVEKDRACVRDLMQYLLRKRPPRLMHNAGLWARMIRTLVDREYCLSGIWFAQWGIYLAQLEGLIEDPASGLVET